MNLVLELPQDLKPSSAHISAADARCPQVLRQMRAALRCCGRCALPSGVAAEARCPQALRQMRAALRRCGRCALPSGVAADVRCPQVLRQRYLLGYVYMQIHDGDANVIHILPLGDWDLPPAPT